MKKFLILLSLALPVAPTVFAHNFCAEQRQKNTKFLPAKTALASPLLAQYDVKYVKLDLAMSHLNTSFSGSATTQAITLQSMGTYAFELNDSITIDSAKFNGVLAPVSHLDTNVQGIVLPSALSPGASFSAQIFYHGIGQNGNGFFTHGLNHHNGANSITFSLSDPDLAKDWWPCKQSLSDKIDSADLWFTVPAAAKAGSNGTLMNVTALGSDLRYEWRTRYPIDYYLISVAIAPYVALEQMVHFSGSNDSMPVLHYLYDTASFFPQFAAVIDSTPGIINYFSQLFGRYPFWKEKYGHCLAPLNGGMEHQTMTTLGINLPTTIIPHELGHQWWGDNVTYSSWRDIWLSEGWASFCELLFVEHFQGVAALKTFRGNTFAHVMAAPGGSVIVDDTTDVTRIFDPRLTYDKGAAVAHMLRYIAPSDSVFFAGLQEYQQRYAYGLANTDSFRMVMEAAYGRSLDTFFNQWVYGEGYPNYNGSWNQKGSDVYIELRQTTSAPSSVAAFAMPVELKLSSSGGDTTIRIYLDRAQQLYHFSWAQSISGFSIDPDDDIVNGTGSITNDPALGVPSQQAQGISVMPNPSSSGSWKLRGLRAGSTLLLYDMSGRLVWRCDNTSGDAAIDNRQLPAGIYALKVQQPGAPEAGFVLEKR